MRPLAVTLIGPALAPVPTTNEIGVEDTSVKERAGVPLTVTAVVPVRLAPVIVTVVPELPLVGVKLEMTGAFTAGAAVTVKVGLFPVPRAVVTAIGPVLAPGGTVAVMLVPLEATWKPAPAPLKVTATAPATPVPVMVTAVPAGPLVGVIAVIAGTGGGGGGGGTVKAGALVPGVTRGVTRD